jgi:microcin C transport system substrate-binding protein
LPSKEEIELLGKAKIYSQANQNKTSKTRKEEQNKVLKNALSRVYKNPTNYTYEQKRANKAKAIELFYKAGYRFKNGILVDKNNNQFKFKILISSKIMKRVVAPFVYALKKIGIEAEINLMEINRYVSKIQKFDFDMIVSVFSQSLSPGNEQFGYFSSLSANINGSRNMSGIQNKMLDFLLTKIVNATTKTKLQTAVKAMDRILLHSHILIPQFYNKYERVAYWKNKVSHPKIFPAYGVDMDSWWANDEENNKEINIEKLSSRTENEY